MHNNDDPLPHATTAVDPRALEDRHLACPHLAVGHAPAITTCVVHRGRSCRVETDVFTNERKTPSDRPRPRPSPNPHPHADTTPDRPSPPRPIPFSHTVVPSFMVLPGLDRPQHLTTTNACEIRVSRAATTGLVPRQIRYYHLLPTFTTHADRMNFRRPPKPRCHRTYVFLPTFLNTPRLTTIVTRIHLNSHQGPDQLPHACLRSGT